MFPDSQERTLPALLGTRGGGIEAPRAPQHRWGLILHLILQDFGRGMAMCLSRRAVQCQQPGICNPGCILELLVLRRGVKMVWVGIALRKQTTAPQGMMQGDSGT